MPNVRIAGLQTGVHPRAVYFAAAAQVIMDDKAAAAADADRDPRAAKMKRAEGRRGHYVPFGGFDALLREIQAVLTKLAFSRAYLASGALPAQTALSRQSCARRAPAPTRRAAHNRCGSPAPARPR